MWRSSKGPTQRVRHPLPTRDELIKSHMEKGSQDLGLGSACCERVCCPGFTTLRPRPRLASSRQANAEPRKRFPRSAACCAEVLQPAEPRRLIFFFTPSAYYAPRAAEPESRRLWLLRVLRGSYLPCLTRSAIADPFIGFRAPSRGLPTSTRRARLSYKKIRESLPDALRALLEKPVSYGPAKGAHRARAPGVWDSRADPTRGPRVDSSESRDLGSVRLERRTRLEKKASTFVVRHRAVVSCAAHTCRHGLPRVCPRAPAQARPAPQAQQLTAQDNLFLETSSLISFTSAHLFSLLSHTRLFVIVSRLKLATLGRPMASGPRRPAGHNHELALQLRVSCSRTLLRGPSR